MQDIAIYIFTIFLYNRMYRVKTDMQLQFTKFIGFLKLQSQLIGSQVKTPFYLSTPHLIPYLGNRGYICDWDISYLKVNQLNKSLEVGWTSLLKRAPGLDKRLVME